MASVAKLKVAIIGGGPSAFYCASRILSRVPLESPLGKSVEVHIYDRLWAPHGLVRYGVAPDHPEVKNCTNKFDETASDPRFKFFGNVNIGSVPSFPHTVQIPLSNLRPYYSHLVLAYGASLPFVLPSLGSSAIPALSIVHWYTGHPSSTSNTSSPNPHSNPYPSPFDLASTRHMTLMGHGNVSLDIARLLLSSPERLSPLDIPQPVLDIMSTSKLEHISIVSRRGPAQVSFTAKELRELLNLPGVAMVPIPSDVFAANAPSKPTRQQSRILDLLKKGSAAKVGSGDVKKTWSLEFFRSPIRPLDPSDGSNSSSLSNASKNHAHGGNSRGVLFGINELDAQERAVPTGQTVSAQTDIVVNSVGYRSEPLESEWHDGMLGRVHQHGSRVSDANDHNVGGVYTSGWAANGAKGVLATTMMDAYSVAERILEDNMEAPITTGGVAGSFKNSKFEAGIPQELERPDKRVISYEDWKRIDAEEIRRGQAMNKERERMTWTEINNFLA